MMVMTPKPVSSPLVSVVIPVRNGSATLSACLRSIGRSSYRNIEVIVVDDHSTDNTAEIAAGYRCTLIPAGSGTGANNARNIGAAAAAGELIIFLDADIVIRRETILEIVETLEDESIDAVVGIYTARHRHESFVSQYKNLWVRYSYIKSPPAIDWLFGSISGIRRPSFEKLGGFNVDLLARHGHDDIELGKRLSRANLNIVLNMDLEVEHLKHYTLGSFVRNEFHRSLGFSQLAVQYGETAQSFRSGFVNVYPSFVISTVLSVLLIVLGCAELTGMLPAWLFPAALAVYFLLNIRFLNYLEQVRGLFAMLIMVPFLFIDHCVCFAGSVAGTLLGILRPRPIDRNRMAGQ
jgi:glycosyltransferase involved in cell wall biosynthesis